jgi:hypothetical protein
LPRPRLGRSVDLWSTAGAASQRREVGDDGWALLFEHRKHPPRVRRGGPGVRSGQSTKAASALRLNGNVRRLAYSAERQRVGPANPHGGAIGSK